MNRLRHCCSVTAGLLSIGMLLIQSQAGEMDQPGSRQTVSAAGIQGPVRILDDSFDPRFPSAMNAGIPSSFGPVSAVNPLESVSIQPDGRIVVGGRISSDRGAFLGLARLNPDGEVDSTFHPGTALGSVTAHAMDDSGNIYAHTYFENGERGLVKLNSTGAVMWTMPIENPSTW